ncbi:MAG: concentrative nucleoside transporter, family [Pseudomonadota bacterium]|nr:concentrative nucleoside transporter, family [Pseudomonadota bacterium]
MAQILFGLMGLAGLLGIAWLFSDHRRCIDWRLVGIGLALQLLLASFVLLTPWGAQIFGVVSAGFVKLLSFTHQGTRFVLGDLADMQKFGFVFAFQALPILIFFAALTSVLYHFGVMQMLVSGMAWGITRLMRVSGAETLSVCANAFVGQTEAPLVVKPYIATMTASELLTLMVGGMATIAGSVMGAYVTMLGGSDPQAQAYFARHLITASLMAVPATLVIAKILCPETAEPLTRGQVRIAVEKTAANAIDAAAAGAAEGLKLAANVGAMLLAFIALIALIDAPLGWMGDLTGLNALLGHDLSLTLVFGYLMAPIAWLIGVPWVDAVNVGSLLGVKIVLNEFVAYSQLAKMQDGLSPTSTVIATYALCGFANFSSIAIQLGGIGGIAPERRSDLAQLGLKAVLGGVLATLMTATIAGVLTSLGAG